MAEMLIKQSNGLYCIWGSISESIIVYNATKKEIINYRTKRSRKEHVRRFEEVEAQLEKGEKPYAQWTMTFKEALKEHNKNHGKLDPIKIR